MKGRTLLSVARGKHQSHARDVDPHPDLIRKAPGLYMEMGVTAEVVAQRYRISREAQDEYALISQQRTARAQQEGFFKQEIAPMYVTMALQDKKTGGKTGTAETCLRPGSVQPP